MFFRQWLINNNSVKTVQKFRRKDLFFQNKISDAFLKFCTFHSPDNLLTNVLRTRIRSPYHKKVPADYLLTKGIRHYTFIKKRQEEIINFFTGFFDLVQKKKACRTVFNSSGQCPGLVF